MEGAKATLMIGEGIEHLEFTMQLYRWQVARGKLAIFEHPATSRGWKEECVEKAAAMKGVQRVRGHQCVRASGTRRPEQEAHRLLGQRRKPSKEAKPKM